MKFILTILIFIFSIALSFSQDKPKSYHYALKAHGSRGFIMEHRNDIGHLIKGYPTSQELTLSMKTNGKEAWNQLLNFPEYGFSIAHVDLHNKEQLGYMIVLGSFVDFALLRKRNHELFGRIGTGLTINSKAYHASKNNKNTLISTPLSYLIQSRLTYRYHINHAWAIEVATDITHASNGGFKMPNKGINIASCMLGAQYTLSKERPQFYHHEFTNPHLRTWEMRVLLSMGMNAVTPHGKKAFPFANLSIYAARVQSHFNTIHLGVDGLYSLAIKNMIQTAWRNQDEEPSQQRWIRHAIFIGHELRVGPLSFLTQLGRYVQKPALLNANYYQRWGLIYHFHEHMFAQISVRTHKAVAEQTEFGIGWKW